ncbi:hypothetical protein DSCO28_52300 [Desulfosarcina ovata subsp. sediminis]|uniref:Uncharacterized protein n=1 Tax=Desulfosarcina ovata subsp. sediminis TaxID=885957 RepID=A0A5K7ZWW1_9BACT|nr:DUF6364 family protein [Desulfosarcina ovata]BBO84664.1 hypothetical protein DSCO28_52300 [Desulfosarcina ovata subsp. sediminis]
MANITLSVDEDVIKKVRKIAVDKNTTLTAMVREYLISVAKGEDRSKDRLAREMRASFAALSRDMGDRCWIREDLHAR